MFYGRSSCGGGWESILTTQVIYFAISIFFEGLLSILYFMVMQLPVFYHDLAVMRFDDALLTVLVPVRWLTVVGRIQVWPCRVRRLPRGLFTAVDHDCCCDAAISCFQETLHRFLFMGFCAITFALVGFPGSLPVVYQLGRLNENSVSSAAANLTNLDYWC